MHKYDLEGRLIDHAVLLIELTKSMSKSFTGRHLANQLVRSATSAALNYGEAQSAESKKDFIHKIKLVLKELRETSVCLKIIHRCHIFRNEPDIIAAETESHELISIFVKSIETATKNQNSMS